MGKSLLAVQSFRDALLKSTKVDNDHSYSFSTVFFRSFTESGSITWGYRTYKDLIGGSRELILENSGLASKEVALEDSNQAFKQWFFRTAQ